MNTSSYVPIALATSLWACAAAAAPYTVSVDGSEVTDHRTGLIWRRCTEGLSWNGSACIGRPLSFSHEQALAHAQTQTGWRLPNVKELASIALGNLSHPSIDREAFPETPNWFYWSSTPYARGPGGAWGVSFDDGQVAATSRSSFGYYARLVR